MAAFTFVYSLYVIWPDTNLSFRSLVVKSPIYIWHDAVACSIAIWCHDFIWSYQPLTFALPIFASNEWWTEFILTVCWFVWKTNKNIAQPLPYVQLIHEPLCGIKNFLSLSAFQCAKSQMQESVWWKDEIKPLLLSKEVELRRS